MKLCIEGYVAFLDILGFSRIVAKDSFHERFEAYIGIIRDAVDYPRSSLEFEISSDSVVIYSNGLNLVHLQNLLTAISTISFRLLTEIQIPLRGAVSAGKYWRFKSNDGHLMFSGAPIVDAVEFEKEQLWLGIMITPKMLENIPHTQELFAILNDFNNSTYAELNAQMPWPLLVWRQENIPFRYRNSLNERSFAGIVIIPSSPNCKSPEELICSLETYIKKLKELKIMAPTPEAQQKYSATMFCLENIRKKWNRIISNSK